MSELLLSDGENTTVLPQTEAEKARQVPDPVTYHLLCVLPKAEEEYESGLAKAGQTMHFEEVMSPVLFVAKMGPSIYVKKMVDLIFAQAGYRYSSNFFNSTLFKKLVIPYSAGTIPVTLSGASTYVGNAAVQSAVYTVSVEVFQARLAGGGQIEGIDFASTPFRMGRSLFNKCVGLLGSYMDTDSLAQ